MACWFIPMKAASRLDEMLCTSATTFPPGVRLLTHVGKKNNLFSRPFAVGAVATVVRNMIDNTTVNNKHKSIYQRCFTLVEVGSFCFN